MKKIIKSKIFSLLLGIIVSAGIYVTAATIMANRITYNDGTVKTALDTLYQRAGIEKYTGPFTFEADPNQDITIQTAGKLIKGNFKVNAIPSQYKNLSTVTTVSAEDILMGKKAYDNNGTLIVGTWDKPEECKYKTFTCTTCNTSQTISLDFTPTKFIVYTVSFGTTGFIYDEEFSTTQLRHRNNGLIDMNTIAELGNKNITFKSWHPANNSVSFDMIYCK